MADRLPLLLPLLASPEPEVRRTAAWAVSHTRATAIALPALRALGRGTRTLRARRSWPGSHGSTRRAEPRPLRPSWTHPSRPRCAWPPSSPPSTQAFRGPNPCTRRCCPFCQPTLCALISISNAASRWPSSRHSWAGAAAWSARWRSHWSTQPCRTVGPRCGPKASGRPTAPACSPAVPRGDLCGTCERRPSTRSRWSPCRPSWAGWAASPHRPRTSSPPSPDGTRTTTTTMRTGPWPRSYWLPPRRRPRSWPLASGGARGPSMPPPGSGARRTSPSHTAANSSTRSGTALPGPRP
ncbi:hypothetical protein [Streptomyces subrutilus]|uniref:hypothetical protein n=1 Tax=Streptomyces subrutilus TaxID=36818 RepID=UPI003D769BCB